MFWDSRPHYFFMVWLASSQVGFHWNWEIVSRKLFFRRKSRTFSHSIRKKISLEKALKMRKFREKVRQFSFFREIQHFAKISNFYAKQIIAKFCKKISKIRKNNRKISNFFAINFVLLGLVSQKLKLLWDAGPIKTK